MRVVAAIPHDHYKIQIFNYNSRYIVKIELGQFEQSFKVNEDDVNDIEDVKKMVTPELLSNCLKRFLTMREDWENSFKVKNSIV